MRTPYKMKGSPMQRNFGIGSPLHDEKDKKAKRTISLSEEQDIKDAANIKENTNQPSDKETKISVRRQNIRDSYDMSRKEINQKLKERKKTNVNRSKKKDTGWVKRTFGSTKSLRKDLRTQQNTEDI